MRCSTRISSSVRPSMIVAPGLNTALTISGKSCGRRIGLPEYLFSSSRGSAPSLIGSTT